jgi:hypothetical protein
VGAVYHTCNFSYAGGGDWEDLGLKTAHAKSYETTCQSIKLGEVTVTCHPSYVGSINRRTGVQAALGGEGKTGPI